MILVIGEALIDLIQNGQDSSKYQAAVGGAAANVALALARRGEPQQFLARLSEDNFGRQIRHRLAENGVGLELSIAAHQQSTLAVVGLDEQGVANYSFYIKDTADWAWQPEELPSLPRLNELGVTTVQYGCLAMAIGPGNQVIEDWLEVLWGAGQITLSHDLNIRPSVGFKRAGELERVLRLNSRSHIIKASDADLEWLFDLEPGANLDEIAHRWATGDRLVVITRGAAGVSLYRDGLRLDVAAPKIQLVDTVGAGDTYMASLLAELAELGVLGNNGSSRLMALPDAELGAAARVAAVAAALVCERSGCEPPSLAEIHARL